MAAKALGAGRQRKGDPIDLAVGVSLRKKLGDAVLAGDVLAELLVNDPSGLESAVEALLTAYVIGDGTVDDSALIKVVIRP
jgi:thymidine phosphorylase